MSQLQPGIPPSKSEPPANAKPKDASLYRRRGKIFVHYVGGRFQKIRLYTGWPLLLGYFFLPWFSWDNRPLVLFDLPARKFHVFGLTLWPQDFMLLAWLLIIAAFGLFLVTSIVGRLWCGYTCPQTVWTAVFLWIEKQTEGSSNQRRRLDQQAISKNKIFRKVAKHSLWLGFSALTGFTFVAYFVPATQLLTQIVSFEASISALTWIVFFTGATYINAGWLREQVCIYMCPYARFQSAMIDQDTLVVTYDSPRGEPRGSRKRSASKGTLGDCVNCNLCVQVCPTGIDIRDGLQIECIQCAHCIDACDQVMAKMQYPSGLIRYDSERNVHANNAGKLKFVRSRTIGYAVILIAMCAAFGTRLVMRTPFSMDVLRDRGELYHDVGEQIRNDYTLKMLNKSQSDKIFTLTVQDKQGELETNINEQFAIEAGEIQTRSVSVYRRNESASAAFDEITFFLCEIQPIRCVEVESRFFQPG